MEPTPATRLTAVLCLAYATAWVDTVSSQETNNVLKTIEVDTTQGSRSVPENLLEEVQDPALQEMLRSDFWKGYCEGVGEAKRSPGDLRAEGFVFVHRCTGEFVRKVGPCEYELEYRNVLNGERDRRRFEVGCLVTPTVVASVKRLAYGVFRYAYDLGNAEGAEQAVSVFRLARKAAPGVPLQYGKLLGWHHGTYLSGIAEAVDTLEWRPSLFGLHPLEPGERVRGLVFESNWLPGVGEIEAKGAVHPVGPPTALPHELPLYLSNAKARVANENGFIPVATIVPVEPQPEASEAGRLQTLRRLLTEVDAAERELLVTIEGAELLRNLLGKAVAEPENQALLSATAQEVGLITGLTPTYRDAVRETIALLGEMR